MNIGVLVILAGALAFLVLVDPPEGGRKVFLGWLSCCVLGITVPLVAGHLAGVQLGFWLGVVGAALTSLPLLYYVLMVVASLTFVDDVIQKGWVCTIVGFPVAWFVGWSLTPFSLQFIS